jgi:hypothetical protein
MDTFGMTAIPSDAYIIRLMLDGASPPAFNQNY